MVLLSSSLIWTASAAEISKHTKTLNTQICIRLLLLGHQDVTEFYEHYCTVVLYENLCTKSESQLTTQRVLKEQNMFLYIYIIFA